jgi:hypothetical protein
LIRVRWLTHTYVVILEVRYKLESRDEQLRREWINRYNLIVERLQENFDAAVDNPPVN